MRISPPFWWYNTIRKGVIILKIGQHYFCRFCVIGGTVHSQEIGTDTVISLVQLHLEGGNTLSFLRNGNTQEEMRQALQVLEEIDTVENADEISIGS